MKALAAAALVGVIGADACGSETSDPSKGDAQRAVSRDADLGGFFPSVCMGQDDLSTWRRAEPAARPNDSESRADWPGSECDWSVFIHKGRAIATAQRAAKSPPKFAPEDTSELPSAVRVGASGVLVGFDRGEWGGALSWYTAKGLLQRRLLDSNVVEILPAFGNFVALTYDGHGSRPRAVEVRDVAGRFEVERSIDLPGVPADAEVEREGTVLVATGKGLLRISRDLRVHPLLETNWWMLHPVALAIRDDNTVYVGMRGLVVELQMSTRPPTQTWLYPR